MTNTMYFYIAAFIALIHIAAPSQAQNDSIYTEVDVPPLFEGCDDDLISATQRRDCSLERIGKFINQHITYPDSAKAHQTEGMVLTKFIVDTAGNISQIELLRDLGDGCGKEAMRILRLMPRFAPARKDGKPVSCYMTLPFRFRSIKESTTPNEQLFSLHWGTAYTDQIQHTDLLTLLDTPFEVRDYFGNIYPIRHVELNYIYKNKVRTEKIYSARLNSPMRRLIEKAKTGSVLVVIAHIERNNFERVEVVREFEIQ